MFFGSNCFVNIAKKPARQKFRRVRLGSERIVKRPLSPESYFIRTGKTMPGLSPKKTKALGTRFLSRTCPRTAEERKKQGR